MFLRRASDEPPLTPTQQARQARLTTYERRSAWPMVVVALVFLVAYVVPVIWPDVPRWAHHACHVTWILLWVVFIADLALRALLGPHPLRYLTRHPVDVVSVVLPVFRPFAVVRVLAAGQWLVRGSSRLAVGHTVAAIFAAATLVIFIAAVAELDAERHADGASIRTFGDAVWWAVSTTTTVGYGDYTPVTWIGRVIAVGLMVTGISLLGVITAAVASWVVERTRSPEAAEQEDEILSELRTVRAELAALRAQGDRTTTGDRVPVGDQA